MRIGGVIKKPHPASEKSKRKSGEAGINRNQMGLAVYKRSGSGAAAAQQTEQAQAAKQRGGRLGDGGGIDGEIVEKVGCEAEIDKVRRSLKSDVIIRVTTPNLRVIHQ